MNVVRFGTGSSNNDTVTRQLEGPCHPVKTTEAIALFTIAILGMGANLFLMVLIVLKRPLRRWSQGLLFHQGLVDCARASLLVPLGVSVLLCQKLFKCSILETAFLLLVTVSTVNLLTSVINNAPMIPDPEQTSNGSATLPLDSRQCIIFGFFIIWFSSITINLGPTFLSGALSSAKETTVGEVCPIVYGPVRHYVLNVLWVTVNMLCVILTGVHLRKLYQDLNKTSMEATRLASLVTTMVSIRPDRELGESEHIHSYIHRTEQESLQRVKMFIILLLAYVLFWGPLFIITLVQPGLTSTSLTYQVTLHVAFVHAFVNPVLLLVLNCDFRDAAMDLLCCRCRLTRDLGPPPYQAGPACRLNRGYMETTL
ncbi:histamine H2 receptor-like [Limulus polyphemus]|uniref:Histamine H2 receptor-like n=1 Tax=Limulus polyphemus TaxID=6850 RepID=A0ABM1S0C2_LIMPO|nr:histamine H2 receptor-like [Limulus polyphemus]